MRLGNFIKAPAEAKRYRIEYNDWLDTGEYCASVTFAVSPTSGVTPLSIFSDTIGASSTALTIFVTGGAADTQYTVTVNMTTSGNQVKQDTLVFTVRNAT